MARGKGRGRGRGRPPSLTEPSPPESPPVSLCEQPEVPPERVAIEVHDDSRSSSGHQQDEQAKKQTQPVVTETLNPPEGEQARKLWVDVISNNRKNSMVLDFIAPKVVNGSVVVEIEKSDIESEVLYWESALIMYVLGGDLSMNSVKQFMMKNWNTVQLPDLLYHDDGYFLMKFKSFKEEEILMNGPYMIKNMPMILRDWKPNFSMKKDMLRTIPLWVKLPQLPLEYWGANSLKKIGSAIGRPVVTDECTAHKLRVSYARILVEIDATQEVPKVVTIQNAEGELVSQDVEYEWLPKFCGKCQRFGHNCATKKFIPQWKPKEPVTAQGTQIVPSIEKVDPTVPTRLQKDKTPVLTLVEGSNLNESSSNKDEETLTTPKGDCKGRSTNRHSCSLGTPNFASNNGFDALGDLAEPPLQTEPDPC
ncbi:uncharacterized protein LOC131604993 [Vicia villosa]|uniref:uncharacterized protein LOC131604993 n=1 Tax=Vicia villosa TaxID=3911 RepID=UPI00273B6212|nr:uncharacterized protein LOC131604993 [Vicia villosa]